MRRIKEIIFAYALVFVLFLCLPFCVQAEGDDDETVMIREYTNDETGYTATLYDKGDVLNKKSEDFIFDELREITAYGNAVFYSAVADSYANESKAQKMTVAFYESQFGSLSDGVIVSIILDSDEEGGCMLWVESYNGMKKTITPSLCTSITDNAVANTRKHQSGRYYGYSGTRNYYGYADESLMQIQKILNGKNIPQPMKIVTSALLAMVLGLLINFMIVAAFNRKKTPKDKEVLAGLLTQFSISDPQMTLTRIDKRYSPRSSSGGGHGGGGGGGGSHGGGGHRG